MCCWSVGLVQREIEAAGFSTVSLSMIPELTASAGAPRIAAIEHPFGMTLGRPGDVAGQLAVLRATLQAMAEMTEPGSVVAPAVRVGIHGETEVRSARAATDRALPGAASMGSAAVSESNSARERFVTGHRPVSTRSPAASALRPRLAGISREDAMSVSSMLEEIRRWAMPHGIFECQGTWRGRITDFRVHR